MIGSPWNPFFDQVIPGTATRYDGRDADSIDQKQNGGFNAIRLPQYIRIVERDIVLTRKYEMQAGGDFPIEVEVATFGAMYNSNLVRSIRETGFCWWHYPNVAFNGKYPRVYYESDVDPSFDNYAFDPEATKISRGFKWRFAAGFSHEGINFPEDVGTPPPTATQWQYVWSLWLTDDLPAGEGGTPEFWEDVPSSTLVEPGEDPKAYRLFVNHPYAGRDADIPEGSRLYSGIDLNRRSKLINVSTSLTNEPIHVEPWYRKA